MSRLAGGSVTVASKTSFDALAIDSGEESEEEMVDEVGPVSETYVSSLFSESDPGSQLTTISSSSPEAKPSKSAIKKAKKLARTEKRQRLKALAKSQARSSASPENSVTSSEVSPMREVVPLPDPSKPLGLSDPYILPTVSPQVEESPVEREKAPIEANGPAPEVNAPSASSTPIVLETPSVHESLPTDLPPAPHPAEKPPQSMTLPLHDETAAKDAEKAKKRQSFLTRTLWTCIMISGFVGM
jgi:phosphatidate cytidylyltransferase